MLLVGVVVLVCGSAFMLDPELEFDGARPAEYLRLEPLPGPQDRWRAADGRSAALGQTLSLKFSEKVLGDQTMLGVWFGGVHLICSGNPPFRGFAVLSVSACGPRGSR